ncbi:MAG: hypothetical protein ACFFDF_22595 [Candidatus Odinarchaeota archaeon]
MNGETVKYHYYDSNKRSFITIPVSMARGLNWEHGDEVGIINLNKNGIDGFFIWKREK